MSTLLPPSFPALNLPPASLHVSRREGRLVVFDPLRRRHVALTPEEWVRQHFTSYLVNSCGYPSGLLANEVSLSLNGMTRRCDTVLYGLDRQPRLIVEYKAPAVALTQKVFDQVMRYNIVMRVEWLVMSNGMQHAVCRLDLAAGTCEFVPRVPAYAELCGGA